MLKATFWTLVGVFILILGMFFLPVVGEIFKGPLFFLLPFIVFSVLGAALVILTLREKVKGKLKKFLILTGASAVGFFLFSVLHNFFYALEIITKDFALLSSLMGLLHGAFFLLAIPVCPIGFLIGAGGSVVLLLKKKA